MSATYLSVKIISEGLDVNINGIEYRRQFPGCLLAHIAIGDKDILQPLLPGQHRAIIGKLEKNRRLHIGITDRLATTAHGLGHYIFR